MTYNNTNGRTPAQTDLLPNLMKPNLKAHFPFLIFLLLYSTFFFSGINSVPFHPDESTYIHYSRELKRYLTEPLSLAWGGTHPISEDLRHRMIDAPLVRYTIGIYPLVTGRETTTANWDWGKSWEENKAAGALPSRELLHRSRLLVAASVPVGMLLIYLTGRNYQGWLSGWLAAVLMGFNPLILLHGRRAMAEGLILLTVSAFLWLTSREKINPSLLGAAAALALNAKQSTLVLIPLGFLAVSWESLENRSFSQFIKRISSYLAAALILTWLLNPIIWKHPVETIAQVWELRSSLTALQTADLYQGAAPNLFRRSLILIMNLFTTPPRIADVGNYLEKTYQAAERYLSNPLHKILRGLIPGGIILALTSVGFYRMIKEIHWNHFIKDHKRPLLLLGTALQAAGLIIFVPLPWQRYVIPLIPFLTLLLAVGLEPFFPTLGLMNGAYQRDNEA